MALPHSIVPALPLAIFALGVALPAQNDEDQAAVLAGSRVVRCLKTLEKAPTYAFEGSLLSTSSPFGGFRVFGAGGQANRPKPKPTVIQGVRRGSLLCWTLQDGKEVLANLGSRWVQTDREGNVIPVRGPQGRWKTAQINDPRFLAQRLREIQSKMEWKVLSGVTLDERPVRCYEGKITGKNAALLFRSGALPSGGSAGGLGQIIMIQRAGGANIRMPETLRDVHMKIFEDPRTHLPIKIECEIFAKQDPNGQVRIAIGGMGGPAAEDDEEDEDGEKKPKPTYTYTLNFSQIGQATASDLNAKARKLLGMQKEDSKEDKVQPTKRKG